MEGSTDLSVYSIQCVKYFKRFQLANVSVFWFSLSLAQDTNIVVKGPW